MNEMSATGMTNSLHKAKGYAGLGTPANLECLVI